MGRDLTFKQLHAKLTALAKDEIPGVFARSVNRVAKAAHGAQLRALDSKFTLRNKFTRGSMLLWEARANKDPAKINAITGSRSPYLGVQETGGTEVGKDGRPTMTTPSKASRRGKWDKAVVSRYRFAAMGQIATRGKKGGAMSPKGAKFFILTPGKSADGLNHSRTTKKWRTWSKTKRTRPAPRKHWEYKLTKPVIFTRTGKGKLVRVRTLNKSPVHLKATHWHSGSVEKVARQSVMEAAFKAEANAVLGKMGAT